MASLTPVWFTREYCAKSDTKYDDPDAIEDTIRYVTRTQKKRKKKDDLVGYGMFGVNSYATPEDYIAMFEYVQQNIRGNRPMSSRIVHEILAFDETETKFFNQNRDALWDYIPWCASIYHKAGFQCVYAVHYGKHYNKKEGADHIQLHVHFIINSVSYINGNLFPTQLSRVPFTFNGEKYFRIPYLTKWREAEMNRALYEDIMKIDNPFKVENMMDYCKNAYPLYPRAKKN